MTLCRLCLHSDSDSLISVLNNEEIINKIKDCVSIQITDDELPTTVCTICVQKVEDWYTFRDTCLKSHETLLEWNEKNGFKQVKSENDDMECVAKNDNMDSVFIKEEYEEEDEIKLELPERTYTCEICSEEFNNLMEYLDHQHAHDGQPVFKCDRCAEVFSSRDDLVEHERNHRDRQYKCKLCDYAASTTEALYGHMSVHSTDTSVCALCSKVFKSKRNLNDHLRRVHIGEKKHQCTHCDKRFVEKSRLTLHLRSHSNVRPHVCSWCDKAFASSVGLSNHMANHGNNIWFQCFLCKKKFKSKEGVRTHRCCDDINL